MHPDVVEWLVDLFTHVDVRWGPEGIEVLPDWIRVADMPEEIILILAEASGEDLHPHMGTLDEG